METAVLRCEECMAPATWVLTGPDTGFRDYLVCDAHSHPIMRLSSRLRVEEVGELRVAQLRKSVGA